jgi:hypothetical protein
MFIISWMHCCIATHRHGTDVALQRLRIALQSIGTDVALQRLYEIIGKSYHSPNSPDSAEYIYESVPTKYHYE